MYVSKYTHSFPIDGTDEIILINALSGAVDIVDSEVISIIDKLKNGENIDGEVVKTLHQRHYIYSNKESEDRILQQAYELWKKSLAEESESFFIYPTYRCNLRCTYCFQTEEMRIGEVIKPQVIDSAFEVMELVHKQGEAKEAPLVTLFGGEPLLYSEEQKGAVEYILKKCQEKGFHSKIITNGVDIQNYIDVIKKYVDKHIQITLDGPKEVHDKRRIFEDGSGSFQGIVDGIDSVLKEVGIPVVIRINVDSENVDSLPEIAQFIIRKGWHKTGLVTPYIAAVRDSGCAADKRNIPRPRMLKKVYDLYKRRPETQVITLMGWRWVESIESLINKRRLFPPLFNFCGAGEKRLCFDTYGDLYACAGFAGNKSQIVGKYFPQLEFYEDILDKWKNRTIFTVQKCKECAYNILCGSGCAYEAVVKDNTLDASPCPGIKNLLKIGFNYHFPRIKALFEGGENA